MAAAPESPLDDRDELDEPRAEVVAEERVDLAPVVAVGRVDRGQRVPLHPVPTEHVQPAQHPVEGGLAALVDAVGVVHVAGSVHRDADQEVVRVQEVAPLVVEERAVGLDGVEDPLSRPAEPALELERADEELEPHQCRLATLEGHHDLVGTRVGRQQLPDVGLVDVGVHPEPAAGVELVLGQEEAVLAVQVADGAGRLGHHVEGVDRGPLAQRHVSLPVSQSDPHPPRARSRAPHAQRMIRTVTDAGVCVLGPAGRPTPRG